MTAVVTCSNWLPIFMRWWQLWMKTTTIKQRYGMNLFIVVFHPFVLVPNSMSKLMYNRYRYKLILRSGHTTFSKNSSNFLATTSAIQYKWYSRVQKLASNFKFRRGNHPFVSRQCVVCQFIIKFPCNAHADWLKQRTLSENRERVNDIKLAFKFWLQNFDKFDPN